MLKKGMIHIYTGDGKGKTTAAIGLAIRAAGHGKKIYLMQFLKGQKTGEVEFLRNFSDIIIHRANENITKFYYQMNKEEKEELHKKTREAWEMLYTQLTEGDYDLVILDEIMGVLTNRMLGVEELIDFIKNKSDRQELVLTGRDAPEEIIELADYVTEMKMIKHPYQNNISARKGIEF